MRYFLTSNGLWKQRKDLATLFPDAKFVSALHPMSSKADIYVGWGNKPSGLKAKNLATNREKKFLLLEDGFLRSYFPGHKEPSASYIVDDLGVYYDSHRPSALEKIIHAGIKDKDLLTRAEIAIKEICSSEISKYNNSPDKSLSALGIKSDQPYVLLLDQVPGDASIKGAGANEQSFIQMLHDAHANWPKHQILIRSHPAAQSQGPLEKAAKQFPSAIIINQACNLWPLLKNADHIYTVSSLSGFEALIYGKSVSCYGMPFYAGWGLTQDNAPNKDDVLKRRTTKRALNEIFAAAYIQYSQYLDIHDRAPTSLENTIDALKTLKDARAKNRRFVASVGMSNWKRRAVEPFLISCEGKPTHYKNQADLLKHSLKGNDQDIAVWGSDTILDLPNGKTRTIRMEDGFLRSVGLGAAFYYPTSLVRDEADHLYYDARGEGSIEKIIKNHSFDETLIHRSQKLRQLIIEKSITKYMQKSNNAALPVVSDRQKILVTGQVSDDASIRYGALGIKSNEELITATRELYPSAFIAYREHPDVARGLRDGKVDPNLSDYNANEDDFVELINWCDRVETITSLSGMEALIRGKAVGVHGWPFYAGWGLTQDRLDKQPRGDVSLDVLLAAAFILYPDYIHPLSKLPCTPEIAIEALSKQSIERSDHNITSALRDNTGVFVGKIVKRLRPKV